MTAVVQPIEGLAKEATRLICDLVNGTEYENKQVILDVSLRKGKTTII